MDELRDMVFPEDPHITLDYELISDLEDELMGRELPCPTYRGQLPPDPADIDSLPEEAE